MISDEMSVPSLHFLREKAKKLQAKLSHKGMFICKLLLHTIYLFQFWILQETYNKRNPHLNDLDLQFSFRLRLGRSTRKGAFEVSSLVDYIIVFCIHSLNSSQLDPVFPVYLKFNSILNYKRLCPCVCMSVTSCNLMISVQ